MADGHQTRPRFPPRRGGLAWYIAGWVLAGAAAVGIAAAVITHGHPGGPEVSLPPVREIQLTAATARARCRLHRLSPPPRALERPGVKAGVLDGAVSPAALAGAVHRGLVVIEYREGVSEDSRNQLVELQRAVPLGTVLAPAAASERADLTASSYRRRLTCPKLTTRAMDALRLFRGRYLGSGLGRHR